MLAYKVEEESESEQRMKAICTAAIYGIENIDSAYRDSRYISILLRRALFEKGLVATVYEGTYTPETPRKAWHPKHQNNPTPSPGHYWVECRDLILDISSKQFGSSEVIIAKVGDKKYQGHIYETSQKTKKVTVSV